MNSSLNSQNDDIDPKKVLDDVYRANISILENLSPPELIKICYKYDNQVERLQNCLKRNLKDNFSGNNSLNVLDSSQLAGNTNNNGANIEKLNLTALVKLIEKEATDKKSGILIELSEHLKIKLLALSELLKRKETDNSNLRKKLSVLEQLNSNATEMAEDNEKLILELEKLKNDFNIQKIELEELKEANIENNKYNEIQNIGKEDLQKLNKQYECEIKNNWETIKEYQMEIECKTKELEGLKKTLYFNIDKPVSSDTKDEIIHSLNKEIEYLRGTSMHLVNNFLPDEKVKSIIDTIYTSKQNNQNKEVFYESTHDSRIIEDTINDLKEENEKLLAEIKSLREQNQTSKKSLAECKNYLIACYDELENYKKKETIKIKMEDKEVYETATRNIDILDEKLKNVYSHVIDLFMDLNKPRLLKVEKELNDCIIEYKEIKKIILE